VVSAAPFGDGDELGVAHRVPLSAWIDSFHAVRPLGQLEWSPRNGIEAFRKFGDRAPATKKLKRHVRLPLFGGHPRRNEDVHHGIKNEAKIRYGI
jgi:hypothetical protein